MAFGTCTMVTSAGGRPSAPTYHLDITLVGDGAYPTGGTAGFAALVQAAAKTAGIKVVIEKANILGLIEIDTKGYLLSYDKTDDKLIVRYFDYNAGSDGAAIEVPNATDLSAVTFRFSVAVQ
jgi:hypothetical protein